MANELSKEKSPYLLQHATNPVHWKAWGEAAFELAKSTDRPIFLSIGYSTCHWCHVMERESFEHKEIADFLNANFVSIKVDREELPEVDSLYMEALQLMTQRGGWPLNMFLMHNLRPFYGGTYFPPKNFFQVLNQIQRLWSMKREDILKVTEDMERIINRDEEKSQGANITHLKSAFYSSSEDAFDKINGGHKGAPKFPMNYEAISLLRLYPAQAAKNISFYLEKILSGGIWDHVGGGIHRYSTDEEWRVPHFEKMLYDQSSLLALLAESLLKEENDFFRKRAETLLDYLERDLKMPGAAFYSAEDADSEGQEGKFYVWTYEELKGLVSAEEFQKISEHFEVSDEGNWETHIILHSIHAETEDFSQVWKKLLPVRSKRIRPIRDEKIICSWNGLMISALARYARTTKSERPLRMAKEAADFLLKNLYDGKLLMRRWIQDEKKFTAQLDDYAFFIEGLRELYVSTYDLKYLEKALELQKKVDEIFWKEGKGYISNAGENVWRENQEYSDNVTPSPITATMLNLLWLGELNQETSFTDRAGQLAQDFPQGLLQFPLIYPRLIEFYDFQEKGIEGVVILLEKETDRERYLSQMSSYQPARLVFASSDKKHPLLKDKLSKFPGATFYVCKNKSCSEPKASY